MTHHVLPTIVGRAGGRASVGAERWLYGRATGTAPALSAVCCLPRARPYASHNPGDATCDCFRSWHPPGVSHTMTVQELTAVRAWARHGATTPVFRPLAPSRSRAARLVNRCAARALRTAMARARGCPMTTTNCLPRVTPV